MQSLDIHSLVFRAHSSSRYSLSALLGSIETDPRLEPIRVLAPLNSVLKVLEDEAERGKVVLAHSVMSTQLERIKIEVEEVRKRFGHDVIIVGGGPHASARPRELLDIGFDYVVIGEGEASLRELLWLLGNDKDPCTIPGVVSSASESIPVPKMLEKVPLDEYPPFAIDLNVVGPIEVTRGCPYGCKFCATPFLTGGVVRHREVSSITHWLRKAVERRGFERCWFLSPNALCYGGRGRTAEPAKLERLLKETTESTGSEVFFGSFPSEVRPEFVTPELLEMFREYVANRTLQVGLQSGSDRVLRAANRHHTVQEGLDAISIAKDTGFIPHVDMIFGLPGEEEQDLEGSLTICEDLAKLGTKIHAHVFMPLPGSEWEYMPAGRLKPRARRILGELARKKVVTGSWGHQEALGEKLEVN